MRATSEKVFVDYDLEVKNSGGHSSVPSRDNAIYHLAGGLTRLAQFRPCLANAAVLAGRRFEVSLEIVDRE
jgi:hypothetical protein